MKNTIILVTIVFILIGCSEKSTVLKEEKNSKRNPVEGSWKLVYAHILENDSLQIRDLKNSVFIKIINESHFAFFDQKKGSSEGFSAGGGSYTLNGSDYRETLDFINSPEFRGHIFPFEVEIKGDSLIQQGREEVEAAGVDRYILEKYIRINTKK